MLFLFCLVLFHDFVGVPLHRLVRVLRCPILVVFLFLRGSRSSDYSGVNPPDFFDSGEIVALALASMRYFIFVLL